MEDIVYDFRKEYESKFKNLKKLPDSIIEKSHEKISDFISNNGGDGLVYINIYVDNGKNKIELDGSEKHVDILTIYDSDAIYELIFEFSE